MNRNNIINEKIHWQNVFILPKILAGRAFPFFFAKGRKNRCMKLSRNKININNTGCIKPVIVKVENTIIKNKQSANGSKCLPISVTIFIFLAKYPSNASVIIANIKTKKEIIFNVKLNLGVKVPFWTIKNKIRKTNPRGILRKDKKLGMLKISVFFMARLY